MFFSDRIPKVLDESPLARVLAGHNAIDLVGTNPTTVGLENLQPFQVSVGIPTVYAPHPQGQLEARQVLAQFLYKTTGLEVNGDHLFLTQSTSESYSYLFKLLCNPGDFVTAPQPSYPLVEHLAALDGVRTLPYALTYTDHWQTDLRTLKNNLEIGARAVIVINPNNPTGSILDPPTWLAVSNLCAQYDVPLIVDEVFRWYGWGQELRPLPLLNNNLVFSLDGLSKSAGLPQLKLGWIHVRGPQTKVSLACDRLSHVADSYLSVSSWPQQAIFDLLRYGDQLRPKIAARIQGNLEILDKVLQNISVSPRVRRLGAQAGWMAVLEVDSASDEEHMVATLAQQFGVKVHPGFFYDFRSGCHVVLSLLAHPQEFEEGVNRLCTGLLSFTKS